MRNVILGCLLLLVLGCANTLENSSRSDYTKLYSCDAIDHNKPQIINRDLINEFELSTKQNTKCELVITLKFKYLDFKDDTKLISKHIDLLRYGVCTSKKENGKTLMDEYKQVIVNVDGYQWIIHDDNCGPPKKRKRPKYDSAYTLYA